MKRFVVIIALAAVALLAGSCARPALLFSNVRLSDVRVHNPAAVDATFNVELPRPLPRTVDLRAAQVIVGADTVMTLTLREPVIIPAHARQAILPIRIRVVNPLALIGLMGSSESELRLRVNATARIGRREIETFAFDHTVKMDDLREAVKNYLDKR